MKRQTVKLPPLIVEICRGKKVLRTVEIPDPRQAFINEFNDLAHTIGYPDYGRAVNIVKPCLDQRTTTAPL